MNANVADGIADEHDTSFGDDDSALVIDLGINTLSSEAPKIEKSYQSSSSPFRQLKKFPTTTTSLSSVKSSPLSVSSTKMSSSSGDSSLTKLPDSLNEPVAAAPPPALPPPPTKPAHVKRKKAISPNSSSSDSKSKPTAPKKERKPKSSGNVHVPNGGSISISSSGSSSISMGTSSAPSYHKPSGPDSSRKNDPYDFKVTEDSSPMAPSMKRIKVEKTMTPPVGAGGQHQHQTTTMMTREVSVETVSMGTSTDPDALGPCEPGTAVNLEGIVWNETSTGVLVVNITWRGKTYVGTLLDATKHDWAPPRIVCESPTDFDKTPKGRLKRRCVPPTPELPERKLRGGKRRNGNGGNSQQSQFPPSPAKSENGSKVSDKSASASSIRKSSESKEEEKVPKEEVENSDPDNDSSNGEVASSSQNGSSNKTAAATSTNSKLTISSSSKPVILLECDIDGCAKKFRSVQALRYHHSSAHPKSFELSQFSTNSGVTIHPRSSTSSASSSSSTANFSIPSSLSSLAVAVPVASTHLLGVGVSHAQKAIDNYDEQKRYIVPPIHSVPHLQSSIPTNVPDIFKQNTIGAAPVQKLAAPIENLQQTPPPPLLQAAVTPAATSQYVATATSVPNYQQPPQTIVSHASHVTASNHVTSPGHVSTLNSSSGPSMAQSQYFTSSTAGPNLHVTNVLPFTNGTFSVCKDEKRETSTSRTKTVVTGTVYPPCAPSTGTASTFVIGTTPAAAQAGSSIGKSTFDGSTTPSSHYSSISTSGYSSSSPSSISQLKPIQPKPTVMGEPSHPRHSSLSSIKEKKPKIKRPRKVASESGDSRNEKMSKIEKVPSSYAPAAQLNTGSRDKSSRIRTPDKPRNTSSGNEDYSDISDSNDYSPTKSVNQRYPIQSPIIHNSIQNHPSSSSSHPGVSSSVNSTFSSSSHLQTRPTITPSGIQTTTSMMGPAASVFLTPAITSISASSSPVPSTRLESSSPASRPNSVSENHKYFPPPGTEALHKLAELATSNMTHEQLKSMTHDQLKSRDQYLPYSRSSLDETQQRKLVSQENQSISSHFGSNPNTWQVASNIGAFTRSPDQIPAAAAGDIKVEQLSPSSQPTTTAAHYRSSETLHKTHPPPPVPGSLPIPGYPPGFPGSNIYQLPGYNPFMPAGVQPFGHPGMPSSSSDKLAAGHKIHELEKHQQRIAGGESGSPKSGLMPPSDKQSIAIEESGGAAAGSSKLIGGGTGGSGTGDHLGTKEQSSSSPPAMRHLHTHHHTHSLVPPAVYPIIDPLTAVFGGQPRNAFLPE